MRAAMTATSDNKERVSGAIRAYYEFVDHESEAFRLVFESDLRNEPPVRERVDRVERACIEAITETITADTGVPRGPAELLAAGLVGAAVTSAQFWLAGGRQVAKEFAEAMLATLAWRGHRELSDGRRCGTPGSALAGLTSGYPSPVVPAQRGPCVPRGVPIG